MYSVVDIDARVNNVRAGTSAGTVVVHVRGRVGGTVRDASKTPGNVGLGDGLVDGVDGVLLDILDLRALSKTRCVTPGGRHTHLRQILDGLEGRLAKIGGETLELAVAVDVVGPNSLDSVQECGVRSAILELDNVAARNELGCAGLNHRRREGQGQERCQGEVMHGVGQSFS
jgi:hypothetical protein